MNFDYYRIFYYAGKHLNITKAAQELYTSQPAVTRAIQNLEHELGCLLFTRSRKGLDFTHEGKTLYEYVSSAYTQLAKGEEALSRSLNIEGGTIYIGASATALHCYLFEAINRFHSIYPTVRFRINTGSNNGTISHLNDGTIDLAFVSTPCNVLKNLHATTITDFDNILIGGTAFSHLKGKTLRLDDVAEYPFVGLRKGMQLRQFTDDLFAGHGIEVIPAIEADGSDLIVPIISHNMGIGIVPQKMAESAIKRGEVFAIKVKEEIPKRQILMVSSFAHPQTNASREFYKMVRNGN